MTLKDFELAIDEERAELGAKSLTLYVPDAYWKGEYRLACMSGVQFREPMYGFVSPERSKQVICDGPGALFLSDPQQISEFRGLSVPIPSGIRESDRVLFCDFNEREGVRAFARLTHHDNDNRPDAVLFVNFGTPVEFTDAFKSRIQQVMDRIADWLPDISIELHSLDAAPLAEAVKILQPAHILAAADPDGGLAAIPSLLSAKFKEILEVSLTALGIDSINGLGTVHLYDPEAAHLRLAAYCGNTIDLKEADTQRVDSGAGIASWVVLRRRAILINDLSTSPFERIHVRINPAIQSELAVPMIADGELIGVLNLESTNKAAFSRGSVRSVWYAANSAALAYQLATSSAITRSLLDVCGAAVKDEDGGRDSLNKIASILKSALGAEICDLWHYNAPARRFDAAGATYHPFEPNLRSAGWSFHVARMRIPVWLYDIRDVSHFSVKVWGETGWNEPANRNEYPSEVNSRVVEHGIKAELGMPIVVSGECVGVAWIKHTRNREAPSLQRMRDVFSYASQAGLVLNAVQWRLEMPSRIQLKLIGEKLAPWSNTCRLDFGRDLTLDGYIAHLSFHVDVCGDFHALRAINESTVGLLIGDGAGEAVPGLLNALPLITSFELFGSESGSSRYVMERLMNVANRLGLSGTGVYCTFTLIQGSVYLSITSAGHPSLIMIRRLPFDIRFVPDALKEAFGPSFGYRLRMPLSEQHEKLEEGDILIGYTDGVGQALTGGSEDQNEWAAAILSVAFNAKTQSCEAIATAIIARAEANGPLHDDMTVCVIKKL